MGAGSYPFQKLFSRSHFAPKLGMPFVAELQQGKLSSAVLSFSTVEVCSSDLTHMHVIVTKKNILGNPCQLFESYQTNVLIPESAN